jgi:allophanate hydrolase subunit 1
VSEPPVRIAPMGEAALLVTLGEEIDPALSVRARAIAAAIDADARLGRAIPAYASVLAWFDPAELSTDHATTIVSSIVAGTSADDVDAVVGRLVEIPVRYGGDDGPDLDDVAALHGLTPADVVEVHAGVEYTAFFL